MVSPESIISKIKYALDNYPINIYVSMETYKLIMLDLDKSYYNPEVNSNMLKSSILGYLKLPNNQTISLKLRNSLNLGEVLAEFSIEKLAYVYL